MRGHHATSISRKEICIFCEAKIRGEFPTNRHRTIPYRRPFRSSTTSLKPPATATAEREDEEPRSEPQEQTASSEGGPWGKPTFARPAPQTITERAWSKPIIETIGAPLPIRDPKRATRLDPDITRFGQFNLPSRVPSVEPSRSRTVEFQPSASKPIPRSQIIPPAPRIRSENIRARLFNFGPRSHDRWRCFDCGFFNAPENDVCLKCQRQRPDPGSSSSGEREGLPLSTDRRKSPQTQRTPIRFSYASQNRETAQDQNRSMDTSTGLENGWRHLRHTPQKIFRRGQEYREKLSKTGRWTGFSSPQQVLDSRYSEASKVLQAGDSTALKDEVVQFTPFRAELHRNVEDKKNQEAVKQGSEADLDPLQDPEKQARKQASRSKRYEGFEIAENQTDQRNRMGGRRQRTGRFEEIDEDDGLAFLGARDRKRDRKREKAAKKVQLGEQDDQKEKVSVQLAPILLPEFISVINLASLLKIRLEKLSERIEDLGFGDAKYDRILDGDTAGLIAEEFDYAPIIDRPLTGDLMALPEIADKTSLPSRPPIVTIMGHVDHGKTTILDWLRKSSVAAGEFGGITQHIGAFSVAMPSGKNITFLDTPGHAAFLDMRRRGATMTDIVILVVAADDSVKPQTIEAIKHAKEAGVNMIVAINKIDKGESNIEKVKQDLARADVLVEDLGGDIQAVPVSGKTGQGMIELEEAAMALSEQLDFRADPTGIAEGWVIEATTKPAGKVATVLVRRGTLEPGAVIVAGTTWAKIKTLKNEAGVLVPSAAPGTPVEVDGWKEQPMAGDEVLQSPTEARAKTAIEARLENQVRARLTTDISAINDARRIADQEREAIKAEQADSNKSRRTHDEGWREVNTNKSGIKEIPFIAKADVSGSVEAVINQVSALGNSEVRAHVIRSGVGPISPFDVEHAAAAEGHILNFNTSVDPHIARLAEMEGVEIFDHNIIYKLVDAVKAKLSEELAPLVTKRVTGEAEIGQAFDITVKGREKKMIAGCRIRNGVISRNSKIRVLRDKDVVYDGTLVSLKNIKKDVTEMRKGGECGMGFEGWEDFEVGDQVQCYEQSEEKRYL